MWRAHRDPRAAEAAYVDVLAILAHDAGPQFARSANPRLHVLKPGLDGGPLGDAAHFNWQAHMILVGCDQFRVTFSGELIR